MAFRLFGLTGGIASGKSSVARRFAERGVPILDADGIARDVVAPGTEGLAALVAAFGERVVLPSGKLDRKALGALVFADAELRAKLNAITHPRIALATHNAAAQLEREGRPLACYEAALLVENGLADGFRPLIVVAAPEAAQIARVVARDGLSEHDARLRLAAQLPIEAKIAKADIVITNDGSLAELLRRADHALEQVLDALGLDASPFTAYVTSSSKHDLQHRRLALWLGALPNASLLRPRSSRSRSRSRGGDRVFE